MIKDKTKNELTPKNGLRTNVCDLSYLSETMAGKKHLMKEIMDVFLKQVPEELENINEAIAKTDYETIKSFSHTMKSSVSIMGISVLEPILREMEDLGAQRTSIEKIQKLNTNLNTICKQAIGEIEKEKLNYV